MKKIEALCEMLRKKEMLFESPKGLSHRVIRKTIVKIWCDITVPSLICLSADFSFLTRSDPAYKACREVWWSHFRIPVMAPVAALWIVGGARTNFISSSL